MNLDHHHGIQVRNGELSEINDAIVIDNRFRILLNDCPMTDMIASRDQLRELGAGFVITKRTYLVRGKGETGWRSHPRLFRQEVDISRSKKEVGSSGGLSVLAEQRKVSSDIRITPEDVFSCTRETETDLWRKTGAVHCSVLFSEGKCVVKSSDVGRHNTVNKVVGYAILNRVDLSRCVIGCAGRQPAGMIKKDANAGIPVVISRAASTDKGIAGADAAGITLVYFSR